MNRFLLIFFIVTTTLQASNEADNWFFGGFCGIRFIGKDKQPIFQSGSQMITEEGCATISDISGNLLFYTNGQSIWNNQHVQMPNGNDLHGNVSSTQSAVVVQKPGSDNLFYVFTVDQQAAVYGLEYSIVDITKDLGRGDVVTKNVELYYPTTEKLTAVKHSNGKDIWVLAHEWESNLFLAYLLTDTGLVNVPVKSNVGTVHEGDIMNTVGYMKASPDGKFIGLCIYYDPGIVEILRFNNSTGELSAPLTFSSTDYKTCYGVEFSPDGSKFYFSTSMEISRIYQIDMMAGTEPDILKSITIVAEFPYPFYYQALQFAPDNKIYVAKRGKTYLSSIEKPNNKGSACGFKEVAFDLQGRTCRQGLPSFNQSYQDIYLQIQGNRQICEGQALYIKAQVSDSVSFQWTGPAGYISYDSVVIINNIQKNQAGYYKITVSVGSIIKSDSILITVNDKPKAGILEGDTAYLCTGTVLQLNSINDSISNKIIWSTGDTGKSTIISAPGIYSMIVINNTDCSDTAYVNVIEKPLPDVKLLVNGPMKICVSDKTELYTNNKFADYLWSTGEKSERIVVDKPGEYFVKVMDTFGCEASDTVIIEGFDISVISPDDYDFGELLVGSSSTKRFEFINTGTDSIYISSLRRVFNSPEFKVSTLPGIPIWLKTGEKLLIDVVFKPLELNVYLDSIEIITAFPCNLFKSFQISGLSGSDLTLISIPDTSARIGNKFKIPIYSQLFSKNKYEMSAKMGISFDASIFIPDNNQSVIKKNDVINGRRFLEIETPPVKINRSINLITQISGTVLLSSGKHEINIDYFDWDNPGIEKDTKNGSLTAFGICKPDLSSIIRLSEMTLSVWPNPSDKFISIHLLPESDDNRLLSVNIMNLYGVSIFEINCQGTTNTATIDIGNFPDGIYIIDATTSGGKLTHPFIKAK